MISSYWTRIKHHIEFEPITNRRSAKLKQRIRPIQRKEPKILGRFSFPHRLLSTLSYRVWELGFMLGFSTFPKNLHLVISSFLAAILGELVWNGPLVIAWFVSESNSEGWRSKHSSAEKKAKDWKAGSLQREFLWREQKLKIRKTVRAVLTKIKCNLLPDYEWNKR